MHLELSDEQTMIRDSAERFLAEASASAAVRRAMESASGIDPALWPHLAGELGWCAIPIAEADGGLGLGARELVLVQEQLGRRLACTPFFSTVCLAANLLDEVATADARAQYLPRIAAGELQAAAAFDAGGVMARRTGEGWQLHGRLRSVVNGASAQTIFVPARIDGSAQPALFAVDAEAAGLTRTPLPVWDLTRRCAQLDFDGVNLDAAARVDDPARAADGWRRAEAKAALYLAAEQLGGAQECLDLTLAYAAGRQQFGRAIATFQAVKHRCAEMMVKIEATRSMVHGAAAFAAERPSVDALACECGAAKALAADTYFWCAQEAIQLHGGVGFTWEYDPQLHFKRAQAGAHWLGSSVHWREAIAAHLFGAAA